MVMIAPRIDLNPEGENASGIKTFLSDARSFVNGLMQRLNPGDVKIKKVNPQEDAEQCAT
jgi:hypothetical protein